MDGDRSGTDRGSGLLAGRGAAVLIVLLGYLANLVANYPGHFTPDSILQLAQGRAGVYNDWHPPVMAWLLGLADRAQPGAWLFIALDGALFYAGLLAFAILEPRPRPAALALLILWMISPVVLIYQGVALKDLLFANAALAGFAALAWAGKAWTRPGIRVTLLVLAVPLFAVAALARQNGFVAPVLGAATLVALVLTRPRAAGGRGGGVGGALAAGVAALALVAGIDTVVAQALEARGDGHPETANHVKILQVFDLAGATHLDPALSLPILRQRQPGLERFLRDAAAPHYRAAGSDNLFSLPQGERMMTPPGAAAGAQWGRLILARPGLYLATRARVWLVTFLTPASAQCPMIFAGIDGGDPEMLRRAGLRAREDAKDDWDSDYAAAFLGTPLFSHAFYGAIILVVLALCLRRWRRGERDAGLVVTVMLCVAGLAFAASFFVLSIDCDYRFLYFLDVAAMAAAVREASARGPEFSRTSAGLSIGTS